MSTTKMEHASEGRSDGTHDFWITTSTGRHWYPKDPEGSEYCIEDIAHALSMLCRFNGHCSRFYSVSEHSVWVSRLVTQAGHGLWGLLHDASEAYLVDIPRPVKYLPEMAGYRELEGRTMWAILTSFGLHKDEPTAVKEADRLLLRNEAKLLGLLRPDWDVADWPDLNLSIEMMQPDQAEAAFLAQYRSLMRPKGAV
jgi:uncharacterized protein